MDDTDEESIDDLSKDLKQLLINRLQPDAIQAQIDGLTEQIREIKRKIDIIHLDRSDRTQELESLKEQLEEFEKRIELLKKLKSHI